MTTSGTEDQTEFIECVEPYCFRRGVSELGWSCRDCWTKIELFRKVRR